MFKQMTDQQLAQFVEDHAAEFSCEIEAKTILAEPIAIMRWDEGFAIVQHPNGFSQTEQGVEGNCPLLWFLYVLPEHRGKGLGRKFVRAALKQYGSEWLMGVYCHKRLRPFYSQFGFRVVEKDGDYRHMEMKE